MGLLPEYLSKCGKLRVKVSVCEVKGLCYSVWSYVIACGVKGVMLRIFPFA